MSLPLSTELLAQCFLSSHCFCLLPSMVCMVCHHKHRHNYPHSPCPSLSIGLIRKNPNPGSSHVSTSNVSALELEKSAQLCWLISLQSYNHQPKGGRQRWQETLTHLSRRVTRPLSETPISHFLSFLNFSHLFFHLNVS